MRDAVERAAARARAGEGPTFIEALTYRQKGHSRTDPGAYRPEGELEQWLKRDPILLFERALVEAEFASEGELRAERDDAQKTVREATDRVLSWPEPAPETRFRNVYT